MRLAIVTTHPIQYNAPWFKLLKERDNLEIKVFYTWSQVQQGPKFDPDFGKVVEWDIPLLEGYEYEFVENISKKPGSHHFKGIDNPTLNKKISDWSPDSVLIIGWAYKSHLACMKYFKKKVKVIFRGDSTLLNETAGLRKIARRLFLRYVYSFVDYALYVGENNKKYYLVHGLREKQLISAPHAIDNNRFGNSIHDEAAKRWRRELNMEKDFVLLYAGKLEEKKNPEAMLEIASETTGNDVKFLIVGNGPLENDLKKKAAHDKRIIFMDFQNQSVMPSVYRLGDIYVMPSKSETWGLGANEAMASGLPVILSSHVGGAVDLVKENGLIYELQKVDKVADYINHLKTSSKLYQEAKKASLRHIKNFDFSEIAEAVEKTCFR